MSAASPVSLYVTFKTISHRPIEPDPACLPSIFDSVPLLISQDNPAALASLIVTFWRRNTRVLVLPPKIGAPAGSAGAVGVRRVGED